MVLNVSDATVLQRNSGLLCSASAGYRFKFIINSKYLIRQAKADACALCHSGLRKEIKPAFSFQVGDKLDDFSKPDYNVIQLPCLMCMETSMACLLQVNVFVCLKWIVHPATTCMKMSR